jgi:AbrB family looped-hinge helix DNA binding protein
MRNTITARGQTVIPAQIRKYFHLSPSDGLEWMIDKEGIRIIPVEQDPVSAFRAQGKGDSVTRLLKERSKDKSKE